MIEEFQRVKIDGYLLSRLVMHPRDNVPVKAVALFFTMQNIIVFHQTHFMI